MNSLLTQLSGDGAEGRAAFLEKRKPNYTGSVLQKGESYPALTPEEREHLDRIRRHELG